MVAKKTGKYRFRTHKNLFRDKPDMLVLQIQEQVSEQKPANPFPIMSTTNKWRDATAADLLVFSDDALSEMLGQ